MTIQVIEKFEDLLTIREEWDGLLRQSRSDCVFLTHEWLCTWWKHLAGDRRLVVITVRKGDELIGIAPFALREPQYARMMPHVLELLGSGIIGSDYLDLIVKQGCEREVFEAFARQVTDQGLVLQLSQLRRGASLCAEFAAYLEGDKWTVTETRINVCPFITVAGHSWDSYLATLSSNQRYNFQRRLKNLVKTGMRLECAASSEHAQSALDVVVALHKKRWELRGAESEAFQTEAIRAFHREFVQLAAERGWLRLLSLWLTEVPVAGLYGLRYADKFYFYQSGFDPAFSKQSVGLVIMGLAIKSAIEEGVAEYDLLHGNEEYKFHWAAESKDLVRIELYPPHARALMYRRAIDLNRAARKMARRVLAKSQ
jgi:CelD/BcsL family acetyltransferase involved in cellulose biosynthesis